MAKSKKQEVVMYTNNTCPYCKQIKELFDKEEIKFEEKITDEHQDEWNQIVSLTSMPNVPTIVFNDNYLCPGRDFGIPQHVVDRIKNEKPSKFSQERLILEKLKTLNFQISTAFMKTDQILRMVEQKLTNIELNLKGENQDKKEEDEHKSTS